MQRRGSARHPLFHVLVTLGVSAGLEACGGVSTSEAPDVRGTGGAAPLPAPLCPASCAAAGIFVCDDPANRQSCYCDPNRPLAWTDCAEKYQYRCAADPPSDCTGTSKTSCYCDVEALAPSDCASPAQFTCEQYSPAISGCYCDPTRPTSVSDCAPEQPYFYCRDGNPQVDCRCVVAIPIR